MLVINPETCIDCGVCVPECPVKAILPDTDPEGEKWVEFNKKYSKIWPIIDKKIPPHNQHQESLETKNKIKFFKKK
jgi:ferredoxin